MRTLRSLIPFAALALASGTLGCGPGPSSAVTVKVSSLATGLADGKAARRRSPRSLHSGSSFKDPTVAKMKISLVDGIDLCTGTYGTASENCTARVVAFAAPVEVELSNEGGTDVDLAKLGTVKAVAAGSYTHARLRVASAFSLMAWFKEGGNSYYTTPTGFSAGVGASVPGPDYGFQPMPDLYPNLADDPHGMQETTYFSAPLVYDGTSALDVKLLVDIARSGQFAQASANAAFIPAYPNYYVTFNANGPAEVETYAIADSDAGAAADGTTLLTLLLNGSGELLGGRTRYAQGLEQFVKDWSCDASHACSFKLGDWGTGQFQQSVTGFARLATGSTGTFTVTGDTGTAQTLHTLRVEYP